LGTNDKKRGKTANGGVESRAREKGRKRIMAGRGLKIKGGKKDRCDVPWGERETKKQGKEGI